MDGFIVLHFLFDCHSQRFMGIVVLSLTKAKVFLLPINAGYVIHLVARFMDYKFHLHFTFDYTLYNLLCDK